MRPGDLLKKLEDLNGDLRHFRSNYMFGEVSRQPVMAALFQHLIAHFATSGLYVQIEHDIERMYLEERARAQERIAAYAGFATFFALPVGALLAVFSDTISGWITGPWRAAATVAVMVLAVVGWRRAFYRLRPRSG